jgi:hypothetical protein
MTKKKTTKPPIEEKTLEIMKNILKRDAQYRDKSTLSEEDEIKCAETNSETPSERSLRKKVKKS